MLYCIELSQQQTGFQTIVCISEFGPENVFISSELRIECQTGVGIVEKFRNGVRDGIGR